MIVSTSVARSFDLVDHVGVAIMMSCPGQSHSAFLYRTDDAPPKLVHLGWHHILIRGDPSDRYMWADVEELVVEDRRHLASYLSTIGGNDPHIPYGLNSEGIEFDPVTGELRPHPEGSGVKCATFMLSVLKALGHIVLDPTDWPTDRPGDKEWQSRIVKKLEHTHPEHAEAVRQDLPCVRFRPEEVVGATATKGWPHNFEAAEAAGKQVLDDIATAGKV